MYEQGPLEGAYVQIRLRWGMIYTVTLAILFVVDELLLKPQDPLAPVYATVFLVALASIFAAFEWYLHQRSSKK